MGLARHPAGDRAAEAHAVRVGRAPAAARQVPARQDAVGRQTVAKVPERRLVSAVLFTSLACVLPA